MKESAHIALSVVKLLIDRGELSVEEDEIYIILFLHLFPFPKKGGQHSQKDGPLVGRVITYWVTGLRRSNLFLERGGSNC